MENVTQIVQHVRQAHWRVQRQWIGLFLLGLVAVAMVAGIYLNITVRATLAGREILSLQNHLIDDQRANSDQETILAGLTSVEFDAKPGGSHGLSNPSTLEPSLTLSCPVMYLRHPWICPNRGLTARANRRNRCSCRLTPNRCSIGSPVPWSLRTSAGGQP